MKQSLQGHGTFTNFRSRCAKVEKGRAQSCCGKDLSNLSQPQETSEMSVPAGAFVWRQGTCLGARDYPGSLPQREQERQGVGHINHSTGI